MSDQYTAKLKLQELLITSKKECKSGEIVELTEALSNAIKLENENKLMKKFILETAQQTIIGVSEDYPDSTGFKENLNKLNELKTKVEI